MVVHYHERPWWKKVFTPSYVPRKSHFVRVMPWTDRQTMLSEFGHWLTSDTGQGYYWTDTAYPDTPDADNGTGTVGYHMESLGWIFHFTDANTAFAFKMRFG